VLQSSVEVGGQRVAIHLRVLAVTCEPCTILGHRRSLPEVIEGCDGVTLEIQISKQGSQCICQRIEGGQFSWGRALGIKELCINQWLCPAMWGPIQKGHRPNNRLAHRGKLRGLAGNLQATGNISSFQLLV